MKRIHILAIGLLIAFAVSLQAVQSVINVGSSANDGTGDTLRSAMQKVNSNFTELYGTIFSFNGNQFGASSSTNIYIKSGATLTNTALYGSTSGNWTVGTTGNLTADTARTVTTTSGSLTLASGSSHVVLSPSSNVGVGTTGPDAKLDVLSTSGSQYRATYTDGSVYSDWGTLSTGATLWTNSLGNRMTSTTVNDTSILARQVQGGLAFDGVTSAVDTHAIADILTSDFSFSGTFLVPTSVSGSAVILALTSSATAAASNYSLLFYLQSNGSLTAQLNGAVYSTDQAFLNITGVIAAYGGKVINYTFTRSGTTTAAYINGVAQTLTTTGSTGSAPAWSGSISSSYATIGRYAGSSLFNSTIYSAQLFNRALSASDVVSLMNQGVHESDKWGSLTAKYQSVFAAGVTSGFSGVSGTTVTGILGPIAGDGTARTDILKVDSGAGTACASDNSTGLIYGKPYSITYKVYVPSSNVTGYNVYLESSAGSITGTPNDLITANTWTTITKTVTAWSASTGSGIRLRLRAGSSATVTAGDVFYVDDVVITQTGSILDADLSAGVGYQVPDRSSNKYHGVVSATGTSWTLAQRRGQIRYTTTGATTGAFQLLSSTAIPANALIQSIVAWSAGTPLVYVGTATGTSNIVGHTTLVGSTYTPLTLSSQFSTTGNLWLNKSATNEVNLTVNYMIADP